MADNPFSGLADDLSIPDAEAEATLRAAQEKAATTSPGKALSAYQYATRNKVPFDSVVGGESGELPKSALDWGALEKEAPLLAKRLREEPGFAAVAQDDADKLSWMERWLGGWRDIAYETKEAWKRGGGDTFRLGTVRTPTAEDVTGAPYSTVITGAPIVHEPGRGTTQLGVIGWMDMNGQATPELLKEADEIQARQGREPGKQLGYLPGVFPAAAESTPLMIRGLLDSSKRILQGLVSGAMSGSVIPGIGTVAGAIGGAKAGAVVGLAESSGRAEAGLAWLEYKSTPGVDLKAAKLAANIVGVANGVLEMASFGIILEKVPGLGKLFGAGGGAVRDRFRAVFANATTRAAFTRLATNIAEGTVSEGSTEFVQELNTILGGVVAGGPTPSLNDALSRAWDAGVKGAQGGAGMMAPGATINMVQDLSQVRAAKLRRDYFAALGETAAGSKLRQRLPKDFAEHLDRVQRELGGPAETVSVPAGELRKLFQSEKVSDEEVARVLPSVARQLSEAENNPGLEISMPVAEFATHVASLRGFSIILDDIRVGDALTSREAAAVQEQAQQVLKEDKTAADKSPVAKVFQDVQEKLIASGMTSDVARTDAAVWAAVAQSRASRGVAKDAWEYYQKQKLSVSNQELLDIVKTPDTKTLKQAAPNTVGVHHSGELTFFNHKETPLQLTTVRGQFAGENVLIAEALGVGQRVDMTEKEAAELGGKGYSTSFYLKALTTAKSMNHGFVSDWARTQPTEKMYARLRGLGVPFQLVRDEDYDADRWFLSKDELAKADLDKAWRVVQAEHEIRNLKQGVRGEISFDETRSWFAVTLTGKADLSTFLHESGHAFLEMLTRDALGGHEESVRDVATVRSWLGAKEGEALSEEQLERFARGFEAYLLEGKAPSEELRGVFATVKAWMKHIYATLKSLDVQLTDEVRGVFDRLLATDDAIESARARVALVPLFPEEPHVRDLYERAVSEVTEEMELDAIRTYRRAVKEDEAKVKTEVLDDLSTDRALNAREVFSGRERLDKQPVPEEVKGRKLSLEEVKQLGLGGDVNRRLKALCAVDGISLDDAAPFLGFESGHEMIQELATKPSLKTLVKEETQRRLAEKYPGFDSSPAWLEQEAMSKLHGNAVARAIRADITALGRKVPDAPSAQSVLRAMKLAAEERVRQLKVSELTPEKYRRAEAVAAREAQTAFGKEDIQGAYTAKRQQLWANAMYGVVRKAREEADGIRDYLAKFSDISVRKRLGKAGQNYVEAIDAMLEALDLKRRTKVSVLRAKSLVEYLNEMEANGEPVAVSPELRSEAQLVAKNYRSRTMEELRGVEAAVRNLEHLANVKNRLRVGRENRDFQATATQLAEHVKAKAGEKFAERPGSPQNAEFFARLASFKRKFSGFLKKMEFLCVAMDGGKTAGFAHQTLFQPMADAEEAEVKLNKEVVVRFKKLFDGLSFRDRVRYGRTVDFLGTPMKVRDVLAVALNLGNVGNAERLEKGYAYRGWTRERIVQRLDEILTDKDVTLVNELWSVVDYTWPVLKALQERVIGMAPDRVDATPLVLPSGRRLNGGYYPIVKDRTRSHVAETIAERHETVWDKNFMAPFVENGFTKERGRDMSPLLLDISVIPAHLAEVVHYVTHYEAVRAVDRLTQHPAVRAAITNALSKEAYDTIRPWLTGVAADGRVNQLSPLDSVLRRMRFGSSIVLYGFKITTGLVQALGSFTTAKEIGAKYTAIGAIKFARELARGQPWPVDSFEVTEISRHADRDVAQLLESGTSAFSTFGHMSSQLAEFSMWWMLLVQKSVNAMAYYGAYEKACAENHPNPRNYAEAVVRTTQTGAGVKDLAAVQRSPEAVRMFAVAYSYFSVLYNQLSKPLPKGGVAATAELAARWWWLVFLPVVTETLLRGEKPKDGDEPEDWIKMMLAEQFLYASRTTPLFSTMVESFAEGREARGAPWLAYAYKGLAAAGKATVQGKPLTEGEIRDIIRAVGVGMKLPATAALNAAQFLSAYEAGAIKEPVSDILFRSPREYK